MLTGLAPNNFIHVGWDFEKGKAGNILSPCPENVDSFISLQNNCQGKSHECAHDSCEFHPDWIENRMVINKEQRIKNMAVSNNYNKYILFQPYTDLPSPGFILARIQGFYPGNFFTHLTKFFSLLQLLFIILVYYYAAFVHAVSHYMVKEDILLPFLPAEKLVGSNPLA